MGETLVLCVKKDEEHVPESVLMACFKCGTDVWVVPWHIGKKLVCIDCIRELIKEGKCPSFGTVFLQDLFRAKEYIESKT